MKKIIISKCGNCGREFALNAKQRYSFHHYGWIPYCNRLCYFAAKRAKRKTPLPEKAICPICGKEFESATSKIFCSLKCYLKSPKFKEMARENCRRGNQTQSLKAGNFPGRLKIICLECGKENLVKPCVAKTRRFCNSVCYRKYYSKRFDRWIASPQKIALPQNYDEFLTLEELPCLVEGCGWKGQNLSFHMNMMHGVQARDFKRAAGFNYGSGIISLPLHETLIQRPDNRKFLMPSSKGPPHLPDRYNSLEGKEHSIKARAILISGFTGPIKVCIGCGNPFIQSTIFGKTLWCSKSCRNNHYKKKNMEKKYHCKCGVCGRNFFGNKYQQRRTEKNLLVACSIHCRQIRAGRIARGTWEEKIYV